MSAGGGAAEGDREVATGSTAVTAVTAASSEVEVMARATWSRLAEPGDPVAGTLVAELGAAGALDLLRDHAAGVGATLPGLTDRRLRAALDRWAVRLPGLDLRRELRVLARLGGTLLVPGDARWPAPLTDLGPAAPHCLWVRGRADLIDVFRGAVALVGARASTEYGNHVTSRIASGLAEAGVTVVSGGAYGIDAAAHRGALAAEGVTVAFLAGGIDRPYPPGNARLLDHLLERGGTLVSEVPPGSVPSRSRFLQRNRLIAAAAAATVVTEAAWRSGALNTAGHAAELLRPVGAVPGPVTSAASAGCHRLLREGKAVCVTDWAEVRELVGPPEPAPDRVAPRAPQDGLDPAGRLTLDALPVRRAAGVDSIARAAGLSVPETLAALGTLELRGLARRDGEGWCLGPPTAG